MLHHVTESFSHPIDPVGTALPRSPPFDHLKHRRMARGTSPIPRYRPGMHARPLEQDWEFPPGALLHQLRSAVAVFYDLPSSSRMAAPSANTVTRPDDSEITNVTQFDLPVIAAAATCRAPIPSRTLTSPLADAFR